MMMMHGVDYDFDKVMGTYPKGKDSRDISPKNFSSVLKNYLSAWRTSWPGGTLRKRLLGSGGAARRVPRLVEPPVV
jgi:hypothetical protein